jgi:hypothetical protein
VIEIVIGLASTALFGGISMLITHMILKQVTSAIEWLQGQRAMSSKKGVLDSQKQDKLRKLELNK